MLVIIAKVVFVVLFLDASSHIYKPVCLSVGPLVNWLAGGTIRSRMRALYKEFARKAARVKVDSELAQKTQAVVEASYLMDGLLISPGIPRERTEPNTYRTT